MSDNSKYEEEEQPEIEELTVLDFIERVLFHSAAPIDTDVLEDETTTESPSSDDSKE